MSNTANANVLELLSKELYALLFGANPNACPEFMYTVFKKPGIIIGKKHRFYEHMLSDLEFLKYASRAWDDVLGKLMDEGAGAYVCYAYANWLRFKCNDKALEDFVSEVCDKITC